MEWRTPFRDILVPVEIGDGMRYWMPPDKPVTDSVSKFMGYHGVGTDVTDKRVEKERIPRLAYYDTLTGLPNWAVLREEVDRVLVGARERGEMVALF